MEQIEGVTSKIEDYLETFSAPLKPHIPTIARFLIVVTFLEDAFRIIFQWGDQLWYLQSHRGFPWGLSHLFLILNVLVSQIP